MMLRSFCLIFLAFLIACSTPNSSENLPTKTKTFAGLNTEFGEPFGLAIDKQGRLYVSDGEKNAIFRVLSDGSVQLITNQLNTPSHIAFDDDGFLLVADTGSHTIKKVNVETGETQLIAGVENKRGFADGDANSAFFNAPIGIAFFDNKIYVADTYNDRIRIIENGKVRTLAGSTRGFADGIGAEAKFDTPCGIVALEDGSLLVADAFNAQIRRVFPNGNVVTISRKSDNNVMTTASNEKESNKNGSSVSSREQSNDSYRVVFDFPTALAIDKKQNSETQTVYVADGDVIRKLELSDSANVETISARASGFKDGDLDTAKFRRPSSIVLDSQGNIFITDSDNRVIRVITKNNIGEEATSEKIKRLNETLPQPQPSRWCYNPPERKRDIAGTFGEIRGEIESFEDTAWFHNGLDIAGYYGETAYFIRTEKVLLPMAVSSFATLREALRMPNTGYVHLNLGRNKESKPFADERFQFSFDQTGKMIGLRVPRGAMFYKGEPIGTLNQMNHVHLITGRSGFLVNPLEAVQFPNISDRIPPIIEDVSLFDEFWQSVKPDAIQGRIRIVVRAFDRMDGNPPRRKHGIMRVGYQILRGKEVIVDKLWTIHFESLPDHAETPLVYAVGSRAEAYGETVFKYIATNEVSNDGSLIENFLDADKLEKGKYTLRVAVADFFGNIATKDVIIAKR